MSTTMSSAPISGMNAMNMTVLVGLSGHSSAIIRITFPLDRRLFPTKT